MRCRNKGGCHKVDEIPYSSTLFGERDEMRVFDLSQTYKKISLNNKGLSLCSLLERLTEKTLNKDNTIRRSLWSGNLSPEQIAYAALDAYASYILAPIVYNLNSVFRKPEAHELVVGKPAIYLSKS